MEKVKCENCGSYGYTASPESVRCSECGGRHVIVKADEPEDKTYSAPVTDYLRRLTANRRGNNSLWRKTVLVEAQ